VQNKGKNCNFLLQIETPAPFAGSGVMLRKILLVLSFAFCAIDSAMQDTRR